MKRHDQGHEHEVQVPLDQSTTYLAMHLEGQLLFTKRSIDYSLASCASFTVMTTRRYVESWAQVKSRANAFNRQQRLMRS